MISRENLVPYCRVSFVSQDGKTTRDLSIDSNFQSYMDKKQIGISSVNIENDLNLTKIDISMFIGEAYIVEADSKTGILYDILKLNNIWRVEFGWAAGISKDRRVINNLRLTDEVSIEYDRENKGYTLGITLTPTFTYALAEINIQMLRKLIDTLKNEKTDRNWFKRLFIGSSYRVNTLSDLVYDVLGESIEVVDYIAKTPSVVKENNSIIENKKTNKISIFERIALGVSKINMSRLGVESPPATELESKFGETYITDTLANMLPDDLPTYEDVVFSICKESRSKCRALIDGVFNGAIKDWTTVDKLFDSSSKNMNVLQFLNGVLGDNGFSIYQSLGIEGESGKIKLMIVNTDFFGVEGNASEIEYAYNGRDKYKVVSDENKIGLTFVSKERGEGIFNLQSRFNMVESISASIQNGETNLVSAMVESDMIDQAPEGDKALIENIDSYYELVAKRSKTIEITTLGLPRAKAWDEIPITFVGKMFSGIYKIMNIKHTIGEGSFSTTLDLAQVTKRDRIDGKSEAQILPDWLNPIYIPSSLITSQWNEIKNREESDKNIKAEFVTRPPRNPL